MEEDFGLKRVWKGSINRFIFSLIDTLNNDLFSTKRHAYGLDRNSLKGRHSYLSNRYQKTKNNSFSSWIKIIFVVARGSVLGRLLFNTYINDLFCMTELSDVCNLADEKIFHTCDSRLEELVYRLEHDANLAI